VPERDARHSAFHFIADTLSSFCKEASIGLASKSKKLQPSGDMKRNSTRNDRVRSDRTKRAQKSGSRVASQSPPRRIFLLSPANAAGIRARIVASENASFELALRLRSEGAPLGEVFSFISGLYFRGKLAYAQRFAEARNGIPGAFVITASAGLIPPETVITTEDLAAISAASISATDRRYREPLERDARAICKVAGPKCEIVLLGSIATPKYVEPLLGIFGERLLFPIEFVGRGDMSRGGLMLRSARSGEQLTYVPVASAVRHGPKPPKLPKVPRGYYQQPKGSSG
jgi:hypothetical protein